MRKAARAKAIIELAMPMPLDNIDNLGSLRLGCKDNSAPSHD